MLLVVALVVIVGLLAAGGVALITGTGSNSASAAALKTQSLKAAKAVGSFHYVSTSKAGGQTQTTVGYAGPDDGTQVITAGNQRFTVVVVGTACYFKGNAVAMEQELDVSDSVANAHAQQWVSLTQTDLPYASVYAAVTASSALTDNIAFKAQRQVGDATVDGQAVEGVQGPPATQPNLGVTKVTGTVTMYVRSATPHLPVSYRDIGTSDGQSLSFSITFNNWGKRVAVSAPAGAVTYASLGGPTGGNGGGSTTPSSPGPTVLA